MNVFIITDLEGISCISKETQVSDTNADTYLYSLRRLMADTNAAIAGAFDGGADVVYVEDGHGGGTNFIAGTLDGRAVQVKNMSTELLDIKNIGAFMAVGAHAMSGTLNAFLDHTQSSVAWHDYYINGRRCGELAQAASFAGAYNIPMVMVSGDEAACVEAKQFFGNIATAVVKYAAGRNSAVSVSEAEAERRIYEAAKAGVSLADKIRPFKVILPAEIKLEFNRADYCDAATGWNKDLERLDARTVRKVIKEINEYTDLLI